MTLALPAAPAWLTLMVSVTLRISSAARLAALVGISFSFTTPAPLAVALPRATTVAAAALWPTAEIGDARRRGGGRHGEGYDERTEEFPDTPSVRPPARRIVRHMDAEAYRRAYLEALQAKDATAARSAVDAAVEAGVPVADVYLEILRPALYAIGHEWAAGEISVAHEHYVTTVTMGVLGALGPRMRTAPKDGRLAVVSASPEERHALGVQMVADFLEGDGWEVLNLGASTPARDLATLADAEQADVVALSTSTPGGLPGVAEAVAALKALSPVPLVVLGGQLWNGAARREATALGADLVLDDPRELVARLRERFPPLPLD